MTLRNAFGKSVYGNVTVDINELAGKLAKDIISRGEEGRKEHLRKQEEQASQHPQELQCIAHCSPGFVRISTIGLVGANPLVGRGPSLAAAKADLLFQLVRFLVGTRGARNWAEARDIASKTSVRISDVLDSSKPRIQVGSGD